MNFSNLEKERWGAVFLGGDGNFLGDMVSPNGFENKCSVKVGTLFQEAKKLKAKGFLQIHNHPGEENARPSQADFKLVLELSIQAKAAGIHFLDCLIWGKENFFSFRRENLIPSLPEEKPKEDSPKKIAEGWELVKELTTFKYLRRPTRPIEGYSIEEQAGGTTQTRTLISHEEAKVLGYICPLCDSQLDQGGVCLLCLEKALEKYRRESGGICYFCKTPLSSPFNLPVSDDFLGWLKVSFSHKQDCPLVLQRGSLGAEDMRKFSSFANIRRKLP